MYQCYCKLLISVDKLPLIYQANTDRITQSNTSVCALAHDVFIRKKSFDSEALGVHGLNITKISFQNEAFAFSNKNLNSSEKHDKQQQIRTHLQMSKP